MKNTIVRVYRGRAFPEGPSAACHRWLDGEHRWCGSMDLAGRWQVGWLCHAHAPQDRTHMIESA